MISAPSSPSRVVICLLTIFFISHQSITQATTASTPALRALSENDYLHLPDKVALLLQRVHKLCEKLALAQDFDTLDQAAVLVVGAEQVQAALAQVSGVCSILVVCRESCVSSFCIHRNLRDTSSAELLYFLTLWNSNLSSYHTTLTG